MKYRTWKLPLFSDMRGSLCAFDKNEMPFVPKRIYFLYGVKGTRGSHAHMKEREIFICVAGRFRARIHDGRQWKIFKMHRPGQALYTDARIWHEFDHFSSDAVMLAISSTKYEGTKGYIMDFEKFKTLCKAKKSS